MPAADGLARAAGTGITLVGVAGDNADASTPPKHWGLGRQPGGDEGSYWGDILRAAYPKGQGSMLLAMREFGMAVFESSEYAARNRSDHWYVYDLYRTYLMRDPDPSGWAWYETRRWLLGALFVVALILVMIHVRTAPVFDMS